jgi:hypothetical protein
MNKPVQTFQGAFGAGPSGSPSFTFDHVLTVVREIDGEQPPKAVILTGFDPS